MHHIALLSTTLSLALGAIAGDNLYDGYEYGNMFYLGPSSKGAYITRATYSVLPPSPPTDYVESSAEETWLSLWIGVQDSSDDVLNEDFVQPLLNWAPNQAAQGCSADVDHWCAAASTYTPEGQYQQAYIAIPSNATLDFELVMNLTTNLIDQKIYVNGELISSQSDAEGMKMEVFYSGNECYAYGCGTIAAYEWSNITLVMNEADASFDQTLDLINATTSGMETTDNGLTWTIASITILKDDLTEAGMSV
ncbi:hypothetical protein BX600DRAFT_513263 [Xylariales sp. PMI_506]|nr:hypothetical protein BX600DRAFT_513263 [Xylariales sp. PMI_506]